MYSFITMKKKRKIVIKDLRLQRIRNNLRQILIKAIQDRRMNLRSGINVISRDSEGRLRMNIDDSESVELQRLKDIQYQLNEFTDKSICYCDSCKQINKDMIYNLTLERWYCVECSEEFRDHYFQQEIRKQKGEFLGDYHEYFFKSFA